MSYPSTQASQHEDPEDHFVFAVAVAAITPDEPREGPWYGPWTLRLRMMWSGTNTLHGVSLTYPQYPVVHDRRVDLRNPDFFREAPPSPSASLLSWHGKAKIPTSLSPMIGNRPPPLAHSTVPPLPAAALPITPPGTHLQAFDPQTPSAISTISSEQLMDRRDFFSTRIPDGVHIAYRVEINGGKRVLPPRILIRRVVLLKENKGVVDEPDHRLGFTYEQTLEQAQHVYAEDNTIQTLGALICIGKFWTYYEWFMPDQDPLPTVSEAKDGTYKQPPRIISDDDESDASDDSDEPQPAPKLIFPTEFLKPLFRGKRCLDVLDPNTPKALKMIVDRVIGRNLDIWDPEAHQT